MNYIKINSRLKRNPYNTKNIIVISKLYTMGYLSFFQYAICLYKISKNSEKVVY